MHLISSALLALAASPAVLAIGPPGQAKRSAKKDMSKAKRQTINTYPPASANWEHEKRYVIMDNDWSSTSMIPFLFALNANMTLLGLTGDTADSWALQTSLHGLALLEHGNLSCVPVALGEYYPLLFTEQRFNAWTKLWGTLEWDGAFAAENLTYEAEGNDPTGGNAGRISKSAFIEGFPNTTFIDEAAPAFMIEQVFKYPGKVSIYAAGSLTNIAAAIRMNASFASTAKELVIMGGYVDLDLFSTVSATDEDLASDINFIIDPEAAHIAVTANWPSITIAGNVANKQYMNSSFVEEIVDSHPNLYSDLLEDYYLAFPLWDETAAAIMAYPDLVTSNRQVYFDVSTTFDSPSYGYSFVWGDDFAPSHTRKVNLVQTIDTDLFWERLRHTLEFPKICVNGVPEFPEGA